MRTGKELTLPILLLPSAQAEPSRLYHILQEARVRLIDLRLCNSTHWYAGAIHSHNVCAGYPQGGIDTCQVDRNLPGMPIEVIMEAIQLATVPTHRGTW
ncbi:UNVERIFIED_CONTAM: hypothetical protein H355_001418 [Colinus virginianus]|nr:hypothetical protein H355_001418 [Colinus virginianus]